MAVKQLSLGVTTGQTFDDFNLTTTGPGTPYLMGERQAGSLWLILLSGTGKFQFSWAPSTYTEAQLANTWNDFTGAPAATATLGAGDGSGVAQATGSSVAPGGAAGNTAAQNGAARTINTQVPGPPIWIRPVNTDGSATPAPLVGRVVVTTVI